MSHSLLKPIPSTVCVTEQNGFFFLFVLVSLHLLSLLLKSDEYLIVSSLEKEPVFLLHYDDTVYSMSCE